MKKLNKLNRKRWISTLVFLAVLAVFGLTASAAVPVLNQTHLELAIGKNARMKADQEVAWSSSNPSVVTVDQRGKVTAVGYGEARVSASNAKGQRMSCKVTVDKYMVTRKRSRKAPNEVTVYVKGSYKTYKVYNKLGFPSGAIKGRGCSMSAVATVMSAYGMKQTPYDIHFGSVKAQYSERYAWKKAEGHAQIGQKPLTVYAMSEILSNAGIKNKPVYKYSNSDAVKMITDNLKAGRPAILRVSGNKKKGVKFTTGPNHYLVAVGLDKDGYAILLDSIGGHVNATRYTGKYRLTVEQLVKHFMGPVKGNPRASFYLKDKANNGGFILIRE